MRLAARTYQHVQIRLICQIAILINAALFDEVSLQMNYFTHFRYAVLIESFDREIVVLPDC